MRLLLLTISILISLNSFAQVKNPLKDIMFDSKSTLQITKLMFDHLIDHPNENYNNSAIIKDLIILNKNLKGTDRKTVKAFFLSELYKSLFSFEQNSTIDAMNVHISGANLASVREKLKEKSQILSPFANYLIRDLVATYAPFEEDNYINNYLNTSDSKFNKPELKKRIELLNKHIGPWLIIFKRYSANKLNQICSDYISSYFENITYLSKYFYLQKIKQETDDIFTHKTLTLNELLKNLESSKKNKDTSLIPAKNTKKDIENLNVEPGAGAAPKIEEIINKLDQKDE